MLIAVSSTNSIVSIVLKTKLYGSKYEGQDKQHVHSSTIKQDATRSMDCSQRNQ